MSFDEYIENVMCRNFKNDQIQNPMLNFKSFFLTSTKHFRHEKNNFNATVKYLYSTGMFKSKTRLKNAKYLKMPNIIPDLHFTQNFPFKQLLDETVIARRKEGWVYT